MEVYDLRVFVQILTCDQKERDIKDMTRMLNEGEALRRDNDSMRYAVQQLAVAQQRADRASEDLAALQRTWSDLTEQLATLDSERHGMTQRYQEGSAIDQSSPTAFWGWIRLNLLLFFVLNEFFSTPSVTLVLRVQLRLKPVTK